VRLTGFPADVDWQASRAAVLHTDLQETLRFASAHPLVNRLQANILWSQRGNFVDVPTDCPQRDERFGWTGDAQVFIGTACYQMQVLPFFRKWLRDLAADQLPSGSVPHVIPDVLRRLSTDSHGSTAWADAAVICPWRLYVHYGDRDLLADQYPSMRRWVEYMRAEGPDPVRFHRGGHFGDWLGLDAPEDSYVGATPIDFIAQAFYAHSTELLRRSALALGREDDARAYAALHAGIVAAFQQDFITAAGDLTAPTQTAHVLALRFDLVPEALRPRLLTWLHEDLRARDWHLATGFVGTPHLLPVLTEMGETETAYRLLLQTTLPSWLYPVVRGATTIWEHWDGIKEDGSFWSPNMNSFNHYAYGAVGEWLYAWAAGIQADEADPGFRRFRLAPHPSRQLGWLDVTYDAPVGPVAVRWEYRGNRFHLDVEVPPNGEARLVLPHPAPDGLVQDWEPAHWDRDGGLPAVTLHAGRYRLSYEV
jgi:alpha-L-rhamnosidase